MMCSRISQTKKHRSVFIHLLLVLLATMGLIHLVIGGAFGILSGRSSMKAMDLNIHHYAESLAYQIGSPPDTVKARSLAETYQMYIRYEHDGMVWTSHPSRPGKPKGFGPGAKWRRPVQIVMADGSRFTIQWRFGPLMGMHREIFVGIFVIVTFIFIGAHGYIRRLLRPIQWLRKGVDEISRGNLDIEIPKDKNDELGQLTEAFNDMVLRIKTMIKSRDQLLLDVSHELRSPITRIKVALEFVEDSEKKRSILSDIAEIETMISEILETERLDTEHGRLNRTDTDLVVLVHESVREFKNKPPGVHVSGDMNILHLHVDAERIRLLLKNLLENAVKFSREDSRSVKVTIEDLEDRAVLKIRDDGVGIPPDQMSSLYEPFYRVDRSRSRTTGGYGLGLHLCKKIMDAHGGEIQIQNNIEGNGVTVTLVLPKFPAEDGPSPGTE